MGLFSQIETPQKYRSIFPFFVFRCVDASPLRIYNVFIMHNPIFNTLNPRQLLFAYEYMRDFNTAQAAIRAGYSADAASQQGSELYRHRVVRALIDYLVAQRCAATKIDAEWVLLELKKMYEMNIDDFISVSESGQPYYDFSTATREQMAMLESVSIAPDKWGTKIKVTKSNKQALLKLIGEHVEVRAWKETTNVTNDVHLHFDSEDENC